MKKRNAFTLIELLVVISIIALLLAILFPSLRRVRNNARAVVCQSNLKQWGTLLSMHAEENQGRLFYFHKTYINPTDIDPNDLFNNINYRYFKDAYNSKISFCPMAVKKGTRPFPNTMEWIKWLANSPCSTYPPFSFYGDGTFGSAFESWSMDMPWNLDSNSPGGTRIGSYGINSAFYNNFMLYNKLAWDEFAAYSSKGQSNIPVYLDSSLPESIFVWEGQKPPATEEEAISCFINRHDGNVNCLFLDWSVRKVGLKELWKLKWTPKFDTNGPWTTAGGVKPEDWPEWMREFKDY
jgi:prepilin-type N-terminal cleavage/methylation domain-containing protein/prepilin-type processing-associated H-X9-DG protein